MTPRIITTLWCMLAISSTVHAQSLSALNSHSAAGSFESAKFQIHYAVGELITVKNEGDFILHSGVGQLLESKITLVKSSPILASAEVYPNPSAGDFVLSLESQQAVEVLVYDPLAGIHFRETLTSGQHQIDLKHLAQGSYIIQLRDSKQGVIQSLFIHKID